MSKCYVLFSLFFFEFAFFGCDGLKMSNVNTASGPYSDKGQSKADVNVNRPISRRDGREAPLLFGNRSAMFGEKL